jgi:AraC-like DNA-binding protein
MIVTAPPYTEHAPSPDLRGLVACYWTIEPAGEPHRVLPDACFDILFCVGGDLHVPARLVGVMSRAVVTPRTPPLSLLGIRFRPGTALALLGAAARESRDAAVVLADVWGRFARELDERMREAGGTRERIALLEAEIRARRARAARPPDGRVRAAVGAIRQTHGAVAVPALAAQLGMGERQLERAFDDHVGLSPKMLARVVRLRGAMAAMRASPRPLATLAGDYGWADQAHMTRDFRALAGLTPAAFAREDPLLVTA